MRGGDDRTEGLFSDVSCEARVPPNHPLRAIRAICDEALEVLSPDVGKLYAKTGRPSIPPEKLLRARILQAFYSIRSERQLMEQMDYNLLFRCFVGLAMDAAIWDATLFTKNRERDFRCEKRSNQTHASTTDPEAKLYRKANGQSSRMAVMGHVLMENRNGLVVGALVTQATGTAERQGTHHPGRRQSL